MRNRWLKHSAQAPRNGIIGNDPEASSHLPITCFSEVNTKPKN